MFYDILQEKHYPMHAFLLINGSQEDRKQKIQEFLQKNNIKPYDVKALDIAHDDLSLGIKAVKDWQKQLLLMPQGTSHITAGIIYSAQLLTQEAQNALLKTLEEPPNHVTIYMEAPSEEFFLPTILSRLERITLKAHPLPPNDASLIDTIIHLSSPDTSPGQILEYIDMTIKNKDEATTWVTTAIATLHHNRHLVAKPTYQRLMQHLLTAINQLSSHVAYKLVLDHIFLSQKH